VGELLVGFSTTNHHVFRGYVFAHRAGMAVQGMGSRTRAYFWPNAFLREFAGLLASRWKGILVTYLSIWSIYALAGYALFLMTQASVVFCGIAGQIKRRVVLVDTTKQATRWWPANWWWAL
jgi:hypothetical protein